MNFKKIQILTLVVVTSLWTGFVQTLSAAEKNGLRVDISQKTLDREDGKPSGSYRAINRNMTLKMNVKNSSMKDLPAGKIEYIIVVKRWDFDEIGRYESYSGSLDLEALKSSQEAEMNLGEYRIGGHLHGTSKRHVDELEGWKVIVTHEGKTTEFTSRSDLDMVIKKAKTAHKR